MNNRLRFVLFAVVLVTAAAFLALPALADPCLVVYPSSACTYHYDPAEYYTVGPGDPLYDAAYDRGGEVLIDINTNTIPLDIYQAPNITGFVSDSANQGYYTLGTSMNLIVDGFNNSPTTYVNIILVFDRTEPANCAPIIHVDGNLITDDPVNFHWGLGWYYVIGDLAVSTPTATGNNYSDTVTHLIEFDACSGLRVYAFSDVNHNLDRDGGECFTAFSHDVTIPVQDSTWGAIKSVYGK